MRLNLLMRVLAIGLLVGVVYPALSKPFATAGSWTISKFDKNTCVAVNRPGEEFDIAPFNALWVRQGPKADDLALEVYFWPGAFRKNQAGELLVSDGEGPILRYDALAVETHAFRTLERMRISDLRRLATEPFIHLSTKTLPQELVFDIKYLDRTLDYLSACHANL